MFEWGHAQQITCFRSGGNSRVTRMRFNYQGNKVTDKMLLYAFYSLLPSPSIFVNQEKGHMLLIRSVFSKLWIFSLQYIHIYLQLLYIFFQFGIVDGDGYISLYQTNWKCCPLTGTSPKPYLVS